MTELLDDHLPIKQMRVREKDVPYMTSDWKKAIRQKRKAAKRFAKTKTAEDWQRVKQLRNEATRMRRRAIRDY